MTRKVTTWGEVPRGPAVYAMYGGESPRNWVAYVGIAGNLRERLTQHFVNRDSSVVTGTSATGINIEHVRFVDWWQADEFADDDKRHAAEQVAFEVLQPVLRSRGTLRSAAADYLRDEAFVAAVRETLASPPAGRLQLPRLEDLAERVAVLEDRLQRLERRLNE
jgi:hypothetical protein